MAKDAIRCTAVFPQQHPGQEVLTRRSSRRRLRLTASSWVALVGLAACSPAVAPQELHNARHAYNQATQGPAMELAPAQLDTARQAVDRANLEFTNGAEEAIVRDLAYVAERRVAIAVSAAGLEQANRTMAKYEKEQQELRQQLQAATQTELLRMRRELREKERETERLAQDVAAEREARLAAERKAAAALTSLEEVARVKEESRGIVITLSGSVLFATGKWALLPIAKEKLRDVANALLEQGDTRMIVEGHTDSRGSAENNYELSLRRAQEVRGYLISQGIPTGAIEAVGRGEEAPIATNDTVEGRAINRRVEIIVKKKNQTESRATP